MFTKLANVPDVVAWKAPVTLAPPDSVSIVLALLWYKLTPAPSTAVSKVAPPASFKTDKELVCIFKTPGLLSIIKLFALSLYISRLSTTVVPINIFDVLVNVILSPVETTISVPPVVLPLANTSCNVSYNPTLLSTYVLIAKALTTLSFCAPDNAELTIKLVPDIGPLITKALNVPSDVIFGWAAVAIVPVNSVDVTFVNPVATVPDIVALPVVTKLPPLNALFVKSISLFVATLPRSNTVCKSPVATVTRSIILCTVKFFVGLPATLTSVPNIRSVLSGLTVGYEYIIAMLY